MTSTTKSGKTTDSKSGAVNTLSRMLRKVERHSLKNGMTVLLLEDHHAPIVTVQFWVRTGSRNERPGITGISHLFEHMMFRGSKKYGPDVHPGLVRRHGGVLNAYTSFDHTVYFEIISSDQLELVIHLEAERFANLRINPDVLREEKKVVGEERMKRYDNSVYGAIQEQLFINCFRASPYAWPVIGWMKDIVNYRIEDVQEYYRLNYAPNNVVGVIVGDFESAKAMKLMRKYWGAIPSQPTPPTPNLEDIPQRGERRIQLNVPSELPLRYIGYPLPASDHEDLAPLIVLARILGHGDSSRLQERMVYREQQAIYAGCDAVSLAGGGIFAFRIHVRPDKNPGEVEATLQEEIDRVRKDGVTAQEVEKAVNQIEADIVGSLGTVNGLARSIGAAECDDGDYHKALQHTKQLLSVKPEAVHRVAKYYLDPDKRTVICVDANRNDGGAK